MIEYLSISNIDIKKYDACISNSLNSRIYAFSWYLNSVCDNWGALIYNDYEAVMPLPFKKKYGLSYIYMPPWVQQLGVFSNEIISEDLVCNFVKSIPKKFKKIAISFNSANQLNLKDIKIRNNYILNLDILYDDIKRGFTKGRRSSINQGHQFGLQIKNSDNLDRLIELFLNEKDKNISKNFDFSKLKMLKKNLTSSQLKIYHIKNSHNDLIGGAVFLFDKQRITYLFSIINNEGKEKQAMSFLINNIIKSYAETNYVLDFEGSMIENIASFFKSFGSIKEEYFHNQRGLFK
jgi:hypothetical protein